MATLENITLARFETRSGERRVYVNSPSIPFGVKVFFKKSDRLAGQSIEEVIVDRDRACDSFTRDHTIGDIISHVVDACGGDWAALANDFAI